MIRFALKIHCVCSMKNGLKGSMKDAENPLGACFVHLKYVAFTECPPLVAATG